ncbi:MAG: type I restriction-modification system subunit M [Anaerolineae bacterium]|nr:type I restriction-modification system subunit M [Anaerolineae bacterium]
MSISTIVKSIQDIMRQDAGVDGDAQRISQMVWMMFLKLFDAAEDDFEWEPDYVSPIAEPLRWRNWAADDEGMTGDELMEFVDARLFPELKGLATREGIDRRGQIVGEIFADSYNYMKSGTLMRQVINKLDEIDFHDQKERHLFNDIYEKILRDLQSAGNAGEYYTPRAVTQFMVDMVDPQLGQTVLDPACGTGGFLVCALEHMKAQAKDADDLAVVEQSLMGVEKKPLPHVLCLTNLFAHGVSVPDVVRDNALTRRPYRSYEKKDRVDVVLTNPPFGGKEEPGVESGFPKTFQTKETADLFLVLIIKLLKKGGRAAIVLPDGSLFGEGVKTRIKEKLLRDCNLHTIVRLPNGVFAPYTGIKTNLLFFEKGQPTEAIWYFEHPMPSDRKAYSMTRPLTIDEFDLEKAWWETREENEYAWRVPIEEIERRGYNLDIKNPHEEEVQNGDPVKLLARYEAEMDAVQTLRTALRDALAAALTQPVSADSHPRHGTAQLETADTNE